MAHCQQLSFSATQFVIAYFVVKNCTSIWLVLKTQHSKPPKCRMWLFILRNATTPKCGSMPTTLIFCDAIFHCRFCCKKTVHLPKYPITQKILRWPFRLTLAPPPDMALCKKFSFSATQFVIADFVVKNCTSTDTPKYPKYKWWLL